MVAAIRPEAKNRLSRSSGCASVYEGSTMVIIDAAEHAIVSKAWTLPFGVTA